MVTKYGILLIAMFCWIGPTYGQSEAAAINNCTTCKSIRTQSQMETIRKVADALPPSQLGFYPVYDPRLPSGVQEAAKSAFLISVPGGARARLSEVLSGHSPEEAKTALKAVLKSESATASERAMATLTLQDIKRCEDTPPASCEVFEGDGDASAYLFGNGRTLHTAFHEVRDYVMWKISKGEFKTNHGIIEISIPIVVSDLNGHMVLNGQAAVVFPEINLSRQTSGRDEITLPPFDTATLRLPNEIGKPIPQATRPLQVGEQTFILGYPHKTEDRASINVPDSDGMTVRASIGSVISMKNAYLKMGKDPDRLTPIASQFFQSSMYVLVADGAP